MMRKTKLLKAVAIFFVLNTLQAAFWPSIALALTSGPTAPEYSTFEPVDTSSMVNLNSGDLSYSLPILEVPGPEGGYPLSLSYHPGFNVEEEASWVGLGWSLNAGAINRQVNVFPDDQFGANQLVNTTLNGLWRGGVSVGVGTPGGGPYADLKIGVDSNKGLGVGVVTGVEFGIGGKGSPLEGQASVGWNSWDGASASVGISSEFKIGESEHKALDLRGSLSAGWSENSGFYGGVSLSDRDKNGSLGVSLGSNGLAASYRIAGLSYNTSAISSAAIRQVDFSESINVNGINLGVFFSRTWANDQQNIQAFGALYPEGSVNGSGSTHTFDPASRSYDSFALFDPNADLEDTPLSQQEVEKQMGGSMIAFDSYNVLGQGIGGQISPFSYRNRATYRYNLTRPRLLDEKVLIDYKKGINAANSSPLSFRFVNDFSNNYYYDQDPTVHSANNSLLFFNNSTSTITDAQTGFNASNQQLAGSKHVEYFTVKEIFDQTAKNTFGFISPLHGTIDQVVSGDNVSSQIGGFMITKEDGMTYHYGIPVYTFDEVEKYKNTENGSYSIVKERKHPYAYTWLLTAITGPDFVDRNSNGLVDVADWGYWVNFDYGKWAEDFVWRNPSFEDVRDIDPNVSFYSVGKKQLYYLNSIQTRTHIALFEKEIRNDGKSPTRAGETPTYVPKESECSGAFEKPISKLGLTRILLLKNQDYNNIQFNTPIVSASPGYGAEQFQCTLEDVDEDGRPIYQTVDGPIYHYDDNVIDVSDIATLKANGTDLEALAQKVIAFEYDYSLVPETINSYDLSYGDPTSLGFNSATGPELTGKLTLRSVQNKGRGGQGVMPPTTFNYGNEDTALPNDFEVYTDVNDDFWSDFYVKDKTLDDRVQLGDIFQFTNNGLDYYFFVNEKGLNNQYGINLIGKNVVLQSMTGIQFSAQETKNPPYRAQMTDYWGYYKGDWRQDATNKVLSEVTSKASALSADVWSLQKVTLPMGAEISIGYEPDSYTDNVWQGNLAMTFSNYQLLPNNEIELTLNSERLDLSTLFSEGEQTIVKSLGMYKSGGVWEPLVRSHRTTITQLKTNGNIVIQDNTLWNILSTDQGQNQYAFAGGNLSVNSGEYCGGGIRVKDVSVFDGITGLTRTTHYSYEQGTVPYEPSGLALTGHLNLSALAGDADDEAKVLGAYEQNIFSGITKMLGLNQLLPRPAVTYGKVSITESVTHSDGHQAFVPGSTVYEFQVPEEDMLTRTIPLGSEGTTANGVDYRSVIFRDYTTRIGLLKKVTQYGKDNMGISQTEYTYVHDQVIDPRDLFEQRYQNQGVIHQLTHEYREVARDNKTDQDDQLLLGVVTVDEKYPVIQAMTTTRDLISGTQLRHWNLAYDFYSGQIIRSMDEDMYGNFYLNETTPAYWRPEYNPTNAAGMGLKVNNLQNKHMLTQSVASAKYLSAEPDMLSYSPVFSKQALVSADIQTWGDGHTLLWDVTTPGVWRPAESYVYRGDGGADLLGDGHFNAATFQGDLGAFATANGYAMNVDASTDKWVRVGNRTLYDVHSHLLEARDESGLYSMVNYGNSELYRAQASAAPARYSEVYYTGFESNIPIDYEHFNTSAQGHLIDVRKGSTLPTHTGYFLFEADNSRPDTEIGKRMLAVEMENTEADLGKGYIASVWVRAEDINEQGTKLRYTYSNGPTGEVNFSQTPYRSGEWRLLRLYIPPYATSDALMVEVRAETINKASWFDDFLVTPADAAFSAYVYDTYDQLGWILDKTGKYTRYEYNDYGQLQTIFQESFDYGQANPEYNTQEVKVSSQEIHYGRNSQ